MPRFIESVSNFLNPFGWYHWAAGTEQKNAVELQRQKHANAVELQRQKHAEVMRELVTETHAYPRNAAFAPVIQQLNQRTAKAQFDKVMEEMMLQKRRKDFKPVAAEIHAHYAHRHMTEQAKQSRISEFFGKASVKKALNVGMAVLGTAMVMAGFAACLAGVGIGAGLLLMSVGNAVFSGFAALGLTGAVAGVVAGAGVAVAGAAVAARGFFGIADKKAVVAAAAAKSQPEEVAAPCLTASA